MFHPDAGSWLPVGPMVESPPRVRGQVAPPIGALGFQIVPVECEPQTGARWIVGDITWSLLGRCSEHDLAVVELAEVTSPRDLEVMSGWLARHELWTARRVD